MLDQMQEMFENMRSAREDQESPAEREMRKQIGELEKLLRDQQALRDDTFRSDQKDRARKRAQRNQSPPEQQDMQGQHGPGRLERSRPGRQRFRPGRQAGPGPGRPGPAAARRSPAGAARPARRIAAQAQEPRHEGREGLRRRARRHEGGRRRPQGRPGRKAGQERAGWQGGKGAAVDAQGRALEALRDGAQGLQKQMDGQGQGKGATARAVMSRAGAGRAKSPATIRSAAERKARRAARTGRSGNPPAPPSARAG